MTVWCKEAPLAVALALGPSVALAEEVWPTYRLTYSQPSIYKAVPSVGVPAQTDAPLHGRAFSAGQGVFEVRGDFDPDRPGEEWSTVPAFRIVVDGYGNRTRVKVGPKDYTAVRWRQTGQ